MIEGDFYENYKAQKNKNCEEEMTKTQYPRSIISEKIINPSSSALFEHEIPIYLEKNTKKVVDVEKHNNLVRVSVVNEAKAKRLENELAKEKRSIKKMMYAYAFILLVMIVLYIVK